MITLENVVMWIGHLDNTNYSLLKFLITQKNEWLNL